MAGVLGLGAVVDRPRMRAASRALAAALSATVLVSVSDAGESWQSRLRGTVLDVSYGEHERHKLDLWLAKSERPTPLVIYIHGGGFLYGKKGARWGQRVNCIANGVSYATISYRYSTQAPYPGPFLDSARAVQYIRSRAAEWNIDPKRIACSGNSAGGGMSLWLAFHDDLAVPDSPDPVLRQSTRITCAAVRNAQATYDARVFKDIVPGPAYRHAALKLLFGLPKGFNWDRNPVIGDELDRKLKDSSPINHLSKDDVPAYLWHEERTAKPGNVHHVAHGRVLKAAMDKLGIQCILRFSTSKEEVDFDAESFEFFKKHFGLGGATEGSSGRDGGHHGRAAHPPTVGPRENRP